MNIKRQIRFWIALLFAFLSLPASRAAEAPPLKVDAVPGHSSAFVSVFTDSRAFGKDPFFPKSNRRNAQPVAVNTNLVFKEGELPPGMVLQGLSGTKEKPLAIINNKTFGEGEETEIRALNLLFRVKVIEIKERSVVISVNGTPPRELTLRQGL